MLSQSAAILPFALCAVTSFVDLFFAFYFSLYSSDRLSSSASDSSVAFSASYLLILLSKIFSSASAAVYPLVSTVSVRNDKIRTAFLDVQSRRFFNYASLTVAARRRILSPLPEKAHLISIQTTVGASRDPARAKAVTVSPIFFPQWTRARTLPGCTQVWHSW